MRNQTLRCFIAIALPDNVKKELAVMQSLLKSGRIRASWPAHSGFHLTLFFLGEIPWEAISDIFNIMVKVTDNTPCFPLQIGSCGVFPRPNNARVVWAGLNDETGGLKTLHRRLSSRLSLTPGQAKQKFSPHITLARIKTPVYRGRILELLGNMPESESMSFLIRNIHFYQSRLSRSGAVHTCLFSSELRV